MISLSFPECIRQASQYQGCTGEEVERLAHLAEDTATSDDSKDEAAKQQPSPSCIDDADRAIAPSPVLFCAADRRSYRAGQHVTQHTRVRHLKEACAWSGLMTQKAYRILADAKECSVGQVPLLMLPIRSPVGAVIGVAYVLQKHRRPQRKPEDQTRLVHDSYLPFEL